jgi:hypothetical protein
MGRSQAVSAVLRVSGYKAAEAIEKAGEWCRLVSQPDQENGIKEAVFSVPDTPANPYGESFAVLVKGQVTYLADAGAGSESLLRDRLSRWQISASRKGQSLGIQVIRFS